MKTTVLPGCAIAVLAATPAAASAGGEFIDIVWIAFVGYCSLIIVPHAIRAVWILWREAREARQEKRNTAET